MSNKLTIRQRLATVKQKLDRRGQQNPFSLLAAMAVGVVVLAVTLGAVFLILANLAANSQVAADANASAAIGTLTNAAATIPSWVALLILIFIFGIIIAAIAGFAGYAFMSRGR